MSSFPSPVGQDPSITVVSLPWRWGQHPGGQSHSMLEKVQALCTTSWNKATLLPWKSCQLQLSYKREIISLFCSSIHYFSLWWNVLTNIWPNKCPNVYPWHLKNSMPKSNMCYLEECSMNTLIWVYFPNLSNLLKRENRVQYTVEQVHLDAREENRKARRMGSSVGSSVQHYSLKERYGRKESSSKDGKIGSKVIHPRVWPNRWSCSCSLYWEFLEGSGTFFS